MYFNSYPLFKYWFRRQLERLGAVSQQLCVARLIIANYSAQLTGSSAPSRAVSNTTQGVLNMQHSDSLVPPVPPLPPVPSHALAKTNKCKGLYTAQNVVGETCAKHFIGAQYWYKSGAAPETAVPVAAVAQELGLETCCHNNIKNFNVVTDPLIKPYVFFFIFRDLFSY
jgi:hypothetical protein